MGHSKCTPSIATSSKFRPELTREEAAVEHADVMKAKNAAQTVDYVCKTILPLLPDGSAKVPLYYTIRYGAQFLLDTQEHGAEYAAKKLIKTIAREEIISTVTSIIWSHVEDNILASDASKALAKPAEEALNEALATIIEKGADAL